jgi:hypothetical protein
MITSEQLTSSTKHDRTFFPTSSTKHDRTFFPVEALLPNFFMYMNHLRESECSDFKP